LEQSLLNRIFCVGNVAQTPQAGYIWITSVFVRLNIKWVLISGVLLE
jgi:hypothetical protein